MARLNGETLPEYKRRIMKDAYARDPEAFNQKSKDYYAQNRERIKANASRRYEGNKEQIRARQKVTGAIYYQNNKSSFRIKDRARKAGVINEVLPGEWEAVVEKCNNQCIVPGCGASPVTMDHVVAISKGGRHHISNLQPLCLHHNDSKGVKDTDYRVPGTQAPSAPPAPPEGVFCAASYS
jgi:5-methylcytosine-specific restriction endonuclease McrA